MIVSSRTRGKGNILVRPPKRSSFGTSDVAPRWRATEKSVVTGPFQDSHITSLCIMLESATLTASHECLLCFKIT